MAIIQISKTRIAVLIGLLALFIILPLIKNYTWNKNAKEKDSLAQMSIQVFENDSAENYFFKPGLFYSDSARVEKVEGKNSGWMITAFFEKESSFYEARIFMADSIVVKESNSLVIEGSYNDSIMQSADARRVHIELWSYLKESSNSSISDVLINDNYFVYLKLKILKDSAMVSGRALFAIDEEFKPAYHCLYKVSLDFNNSKMPLIKRIRM